MDPHSLFSIFEQGDEHIYKEHGLEDTLQNPYVLMGMVLRGVENFHLMDMLYMRQQPKMYKKVRNLTKYKYFNKLFSYLSRINEFDNKIMYKVGESFESNEVYNALEVLLRFFEGIEQYEKCAIIKKYQDLLKKEVLSNNEVF